MSDLCIPNSAMESQEEFHKWYVRMSTRLFPGVERIYVPQIEDKVIVKDLEKTFDRILSWTNFIFNRSWDILPYKNNKQKQSNKPKGATRGVTDVISAAVSIMMGYYSLIQENLAKIMSINRSTISYYIKRHKANCMYKDYLRKYNELLICLRDEGLILTSKEV